MIRSVCLLLLRDLELLGGIRSVINFVLSLTLNKQNAHALFNFKQCHIVVEHIALEETKSKI